MVKSARCTEDPEFLFTFTKNSSNPRRDPSLPPQVLLHRLLILEDIKGRALNPAWNTVTRVQIVITRIMVWIVLELSDRSG
jgi:hypothetical protein